MLHAVQDAWGFVPQSAVPVLADILNLSRAEVHGVISFYHDFRSQPAGRHVLKICRAEACQSMGANALVDHLWSRTAIKADGVLAVVEQLAGAIVPASALESLVLPARVDGYRPVQLDELTTAAPQRYAAVHRSGGDVLEVGLGEPAVSGAA